ncbi:hypothetical protein B0H16DRAFT_1470517 [Mycena metata]|uniref:Uncharacterized protein n=1 Tax=Mycena metata TaxID=1033252 RepID=A0AAD7MQE9_9AGAR|nr:hypothetical protein B0H16DRAFT_1482925 [Mycena metata]KAJ7728340.1 hypothetical protein B0H16DRAFT_1470517 [Mycena metata]
MSAGSHMPASVRPFRKPESSALKRKAVDQRKLKCRSRPVRGILIRSVLSAFPTSIDSGTHIGNKIFRPGTVVGARLKCIPCFTSSVNARPKDMDLNISDWKWKKKIHIKNGRKLKPGAPIYLGGGGALHWSHGGDDRRPQRAVDIGETPSVFCRHNFRVRRAHPEALPQHVVPDKCWTARLPSLYSESATSQTKRKKIGLLNLNGINLSLPLKRWTAEYISSVQVSYSLAMRNVTGMAGRYYLAVESNRLNRIDRWQGQGQREMDTSTPRYFFRGRLEE